MTCQRIASQPHAKKAWVEYHVRDHLIKRVQLLRTIYIVSKDSIIKHTVLKGKPRHSFSLWLERSNFKCTQSKGTAILCSIPLRKFLQSYHYNYRLVVIRLSATPGVYWHHAIHAVAHLHPYFLCSVLRWTFAWGLTFKYKRYLETQRVTCLVQFARGTTWYFNKFYLRSWF